MKYNDLDKIYLGVGITMISIISFMFTKENLFLIMGASIGIGLTTLGIIEYNYNVKFRLNW